MEANASAAKEMLTSKPEYSDLKNELLV